MMENLRQDLQIARSQYIRAKKTGGAMVYELGQRCIYLRILLDVKLSLGDRL